jgi:FkbM family methyltransferase
MGWLRPVRAMLRHVAGRERVTVWRWLRAPRLRWALFRDPVDCIIYGLLLSRDRIRFVQIGSNDGRTGDPLWSFRRYASWRGLLVEPVAPVFRRLRENYAPWADRFTFENVAIAAEPGHRPFYRFDDPSSSPPGADQLGSLDRTLLQRLARRHGRSETGIVATTVECVTLPQLLAKHGIRELDLLHIDAEGLDYEILCQIERAQCRPSVVLYEHVHLSDAVRHDASSMLLASGYHVNTIEGDTLAVSAHALATMPPLDRAWRLVTAS